MAKKHSSKQIRVNKTNKISNTEYQYINKIYNSHIKQIDKQLPRDYRTSRSDRLYKNHHNAKLNLMRKALISPRTTSRTAKLLARKISYNIAYKGSRQAIFKQWEKNLHSNKMSSYSLDDYKKGFHKFVSTGKTSALFDNAGFGTGGYKDLLNDRNNHLFNRKVILFRYLGSKASIRHVEHPEMGGQHDKLREWGHSIKQSKDDQAMLKTIMSERKRYPSPIPHTTFAKLGISPKNTKKLNKIYKEAHILEQAAKDPSVIHEQTRPLYPGQISTWQGEVNHVSPITRRLLGLNTGAVLNHQIHNAYIKPYANNSIYDTENHKHLTSKEIGKRCHNLGLESPSMDRAIHPNKPHKESRVHLNRKAMNNMIVQQNTIKKSDIAHNLEIKQDSVKHSKRYIPKHSGPTHHGPSNDGPEL